MCVPAYASQRTRVRERSTEEKGEKKKKKGRTRARPHSRALATVERPLTLHFVVGFFFYASYCLSFSAPFLSPARPQPIYTSPFLTLDAPDQKKKKEPYIFCPPCFLHDSHCMPPSVIFEALFPRDCLPAAIYDANQSGPLSSLSFFFFMVQACAGRLTIQKIVEPSTLVYPNKDALRSLSRKIYSKSGDP